MGNSINNHGNDNIILQDVKDSNITINKHLKPTLPKELTIRMPKLNLNDVIGREEEIADLHQSLFEHKQVVLVNGLGGIGKTTLSQAYLSQYAEQYQHLAWISVSSSSLESDFINAVLLDKTFGIKTEGKELTDIFHELLYDLKALDTQPNLLILDNADATLSSYYDRLPQQPNWHVLVTSREQIEGFESKDIGFLKPDKALLLFQKHFTRITDVKAIENLLHTIDYHTLTIEILAKTAQLQRFDIATLQHAIEKDLKSNVFIPHKQDKIDKVYTYLSSIFDLSNVTDTEAWLLKQMTCLPTEFHTYNLIKALICTPKSEQAELLPESIENLVAKGWLLKNSEADSYKMHIIIAEVTRRKLEVGINDVEVLLDNVTQKLSIDQTKDNPVDRFQWVAFGKALENIFGNALLPKVSILQNNLALVLQDLGEYKEAKKILIKTLTINEKMFGKSNPNTASSYSNLATVLQDLGDFETAKNLLEKALSINIKFFGKKHPNIATNYSNLALAYQDLRDFKSAKRLLKKALDINIKNFGENHPNTARVYSNLATVLQDLEDYKSVKTYLKKALNINVKNFEKDHPVVAISYSNLGCFLRDIGEIKSAKLLLEKALSINEKNFGNDHPKTAISYSNLALVLQDLGEYEEAVKKIEKSLVIDEINFGKEHPKVAVRSSILASIYQDIEEYESAQNLLERSLYINLKNFGENHPVTSTNYSDLALVLKDLGNYEEAKKILEKVLVIDEVIFGENHPATADDYYNLAMVHSNLGDYKSAITLLEKAYRVFYNYLGEQHPNTKTVKEDLDYVIQKSKKQKQNNFLNKLFNFFKS